MLALTLLLIAADTSTVSSVEVETSSAAADQIILIGEEPPLIEIEPEPEEPSRVRVAVRLEARSAVDTAFDQPNEHVFELGLGGRLELDAQLTRHFNVYVAPSFFWVAGFDKKGGDREVVYLTTPEARVSLVLGDFDLNAGALIFNWGASDLIGPADVLNPLDYRRNFVAAIDDAKIPVIAAELVGHFGPLTVRAVVEPFFTPARFFLSGWDTSLIQSQFTRGLNLPQIESVLGRGTVDDIGDHLLITERPSDRPDDATLAARATLRLDDLELSATAIHGWEPLPQVRVHPDLVKLGSQLADAVANHKPIAPDLAAIESLGRLNDALERGEPVFSGRYRRRDLLGGDAVLAIDPVILKAELAFSFSRTAYTQNDYVPVEHPWLTAVFGAEYFDGDALQVIVESFALTIFDIKSNYRLALFEPAAPPPSATADGERTISIPGLAGIVRYSIFDGDLLFEVAAVGTLTRGDVIFAPAIHWRLDDAQRVTLSALFIEGKDDGYGGVYTHNDQLALSYVWTH